MKIYAIGDLHLPGDTGKKMEIFGENWKNHDEKIKENWEAMVTDDDLVLVPGDLSWSMSLEGAKGDLEWIGALPGKKVIMRGNHDFWWNSLKKTRAVLPPSVYAISRDSLLFGDVAVAGTRLWDDPEISFDEHIKWISREAIGLPPEKKNPYDDKKIFERELGRLEQALESVSGKARTIIAMLHFPPTDFTFRETEAVTILRKFGVNACVYGHMHSLMKETSPKFPVRKYGIDYYLVSSDFVDFKPVEIKI